MATVHRLCRTIQQISTSLSAQFFNLTSKGANSWLTISRSHATSSSLHHSFTSKVDFGSNESRVQFVKCAWIVPFVQKTKDDPRNHTNQHEQNIGRLCLYDRSDSSFDQSAQTPFSARDGKADPFLISGGEAEMPVCLKARTSVHSPDLFCRHFDLSPIILRQYSLRADSVHLLP